MMERGKEGFGVDFFQLLRVAVCNLVITTCYCYYYCCTILISLGFGGDFFQLLLCAILSLLLLLLTLSNLIPRPPAPPPAPSR